MFVNYIFITSQILLSQLLGVIPVTWSTLFQDFNVIFFNFSDFISITSQTLCLKFHTNLIFITYKFQLYSYNLENVVIFISSNLISTTSEVLFIQLG